LNPFEPPTHVFLGDSGAIVLERDIMIASSNAFSMRTSHDLGGDVLAQAPFVEFFSVLAATAMV
jgi:hypothetical protein